MTLPTAILFDWDNTLVDGWEAIMRGLNATFAAHDMPAWTRDDVLRNVRRSLKDSFPDLFGNRWEAARDIFYKEVRACHLDVLAALPGTAEMLDAAGAVAPLSVVSNKQGHLLRAEATHLVWNGYFETLVGAGDARADKPDAAPLLLALERMRLPPGPQVWYVGDTVLDMQAARAAGCSAVLIGEAEHDGGVAAAAPDAAFMNASALRAHLVSLDRRPISG
ncbi:HAD family hydrolase [Humitalea sp. 24SJ18S-53]|uniref:HAD family hydrolase n=1 Tax=Humitalea sp. 24SJ18S-53 TaxID=3422307 RepID=UPI003D6761A3